MTHKINMERVHIKDISCGQENDVHVVPQQIVPFASLCLFCLFNTIVIIIINFFFPDRIVLLRDGRDANSILVRIEKKVHNWMYESPIG